MNLLALSGGNRNQCIIVDDVGSSVPVHLGLKQILILMLYITP
jgi:hypothetical protein